MSEAEITAEEATRVLVGDFRAAASGMRTHPDVRWRAVADLMDSAAADVDGCVGLWAATGLGERTWRIWPAIRVARAYLGREH